MSKITYTETTFNQALALYQTPRILRPLYTNHGIHILHNNLFKPSILKSPILKLLYLIPSLLKSPYTEIPLY